MERPDRAVSYIGKPLPRDEDFRFLRGLGNYTDDIELPEAAYAAFVRSPHAYARITSIATNAAARRPGVLAVLTAREWAQASLGAVPCQFPIHSSDGAPMNQATRPVFADDTVRHVGDTVAAVITETRARSLDAAELVEVHYEPLPAVIDAARALDPDSPIVHEGIGTNLVQKVEHGDPAATEAAFAEAYHVTEIELRNTRAAGLPIEPRSYLGWYDSSRDRYTLWATAQNPHQQQRWLAKHVLHVPISKVRVIVPDVGGGFGIKGYFYPEEAVVLWGSRLVGRPVGWTETRAESFVVDTHARDMATKAKMAFGRAGRVLGLEETVFHDPSHYSYPHTLHLAVIVVDVETGAITLRAYYKVDDAGRIVNPLVVHGQVHGGLGQGIGQALLERIVYDPESGQPLTGSFMDYAMPRADDMPSFVTDFQETPNPNNVLGVKGCSESGVCGPTAAIGNAIVDALWDLGVRHLDIPYTPERVWRTIRAARN